MPHNNGGFEERYYVIRKDGKATKPTARYIVMNYNGDDPHAVKAVEAYAASVKAENPEFADDLLAALADPHTAPAQHVNADNR